MKRITVLLADNPRSSQVTIVDGREPRNVQTMATLLHSRNAARVGWGDYNCMGGDGKYRQSIALSVRALIRDVHSPMDYSPVHARWDVVY